MSFPVLDDLRKERIRQDVSISELSASSGISEPTLSKLFSGKQDDARLATLADIAAALGLDIRAIPEGTLDSLNTAKPVDADLYNRLLAEKDKLAAQKDRVIQAQRLYVRVLFCAVVGLAACLAALAFVAFTCG